MALLRQRRKLSRCPQRCSDADRPPYSFHDRLGTGASSSNAVMVSRRGLTRSSRQSVYAWSQWPRQ